MVASKDCFNVTLLTHDYREVAESMVIIFNVALRLMDIHPYQNWNICVVSGYPNGRTFALKQLKKIFPDEKEVWTLMVDSDILITDDPKHIADLIREAEKRNLSFVAEYKTTMKDERNEDELKGVTFKTERITYTDKELNAAKDFELMVHHSGLGLAYLKVPLDYVFHVKGLEGMEDVNFFKDNPQLDVRFCNIPNYHLKQVKLRSLMP